MTIQTDSQPGKPPSLNRQPSSSFSSDVGFRHVDTYDLSEYDFAGYRAAVLRDLVPLLREFRVDVETTTAHERMIYGMAHDLFASYFPAEVVEAFRSRVLGGGSAKAILLRGVPVDDPVPPSPPITVCAPPFVPFVTSIMLGAACVVGTPKPTSERMRKWSYSGVVYNLPPPRFEPGQEHLTDLPMHRDYPAQLLDQPRETDSFILVAMQGDEQRKALTKVITADALLQAADRQDIDLLRTSEITLQVRDTTSGDLLRESKPFVPVTDHLTTLFTLEFGDAKDPKRRTCSASNTPGAVEAYDRVRQIAWDMADNVDLQMGDLLFINNLRSLHGRTAYVAKPIDDPAQRWLAKLQISFAQ